MPKLPKKISVVDSMAEFFFCLQTYLLGYGKIYFEGILGVPFFMVNLTPVRFDEYLRHDIDSIKRDKGYGLG